MNFVGGSFFEQGSIPRADNDNVVYTMRQILHDWSDADCIKILKEVRFTAVRHSKQALDKADLRSLILAWPADYL
jgi:hypothetical protein